MSFKLGLRVYCSTKLSLTLSWHCHSLFLWSQLQDTWSLKLFSDRISQITKPWALTKLGLVWKCFPNNNHVISFTFLWNTRRFFLFFFSFAWSSFCGCTHALNPCCLNPASKRVEYNYLSSTYNILLIPRFWNMKSRKTSPVWWYSKILS